MISNVMWCYVVPKRLLAVVTCLTFPGTTMRSTIVKLIIFIT